MDITLLQFPGASVDGSERHCLPVAVRSDSPSLVLAAFRTVLARFSRNPRFAIAIISRGITKIRVDDLGDNPTFKGLIERSQVVDDPGLPVQIAFREVAEGESDPETSREYSIELVQDETGYTLHFSTNVLSEEIAARIIGHLVCLVSRAHPKDRIADVSSAPASEMATVAGFSNTDSVYPDQPLLALFDQQDASRVALITHDGPITYRQLAELRDRYAKELNGILPGENVGLCLYRSTEFVAAMLACIKVGAVFVPIDPGYPAERTKFMIEDCQARFLFTYENDEVTVVPRPGPYARSSENALYVLYTSGSTGRPKGVIGTHTATLNRLHWMWRKFPYEPDDVACAKTSPNFVDAIAEILGPVLQGVPLVVLDDATARDPMALAAAIDRFKVTRLIVVPALLRVLLEHRARLSPLRHIVSSGEALLPDLAAETLKAIPKVQLINLYGSSEIAGDATYHVVRPPFNGIVPIGRPIANTQIHVLDPAGALAPLLAKGEIAVGGANLAAGYLNREDLSAAKFKDHPTLGRLYLTGDIGQWLPDGTLVYHGREDTMIKVRGHRIELYEIEINLKTLPGIDECAVITGPEEAAILAYYSPQYVSKEALREHIRSKLPQYMMPSRFIPMDRLPKLPNGKIDRRSLPPPPENEKCDPPVGELEEKVHRIFSEVLGVQAVGREENFFDDRGGDSLRAASAASRLARELRIEITAMTIFEAPSIAELAALCSVILDVYQGQIEETPEADFEAALAAEYALTPSGRQIPTRGDRTRAPLSMQQQRLWLLEQIEPAGSLYNIPTAFRIRGSVDPKRLGAAVNRLVVRHESLRTAIQTENGSPIQVVLPPTHVEIPILEAKDDQELQRISEGLASTKFTLENGRLFRTALVRQAKDEHVFFLTTHHIISDGWSITLLARELAQLYGDPEKELDPLPIQYGDYAAWQHDWISSDTILHQTDFWKKKLGGPLPLLDFPTDFPRPATQSHRGRIVPIDLPAAHVANIQEACEGVTPFMVLLAFFQALLWRLSGQTDILVGTPYAGRTRAEIEGIAGFFVNTLVLRSSLHPHLSVRDLLRQVRETTLLAFDHPDVPFESVVEELKPERNLAYSPIFQSFFVLNTPSSPSEDNELPIEIEEHHNQGAKFDLTLELTQQEDHISGRFEYPIALFSHETVRAFSDQFELAIHRAAADPDIVLEDLFLPESQPPPATSKFNRESLIAGIFEKRDLSAPALVTSQGVLDFAEVKRRVAKLTSILKDQGAVPGDVIAINIKRSPEAVIALLASLSVGGIYLPLDPDYPRERTDFMLQDAAPSLLIGEGLVVTRLGQGKQLGNELDAAYLLYTSGSTGRPKGVIGTHHATLNRLRWMDRCYPFTPDDVAIQKTSLNFVDSVAEIFGPLRAGIPLVFADDSLPESLAAAISGYNVTRLVAVPSLLRALLDHADKLRALRLIVSSGEILPKDLATDLLSALPQAKLINLYGSSEVAADVTYFEVTADSLRRASIPIGAAIDNAHVNLVDAKRRVVPDGFPGQIAVSGPVQAAGYLNGPQDRFVDGMFLTGDLGRRVPGTDHIEYMGRKDRQIKVRGVRIEPDEVEAHLRSHPTVRDAAVFLHRDSLAAVVASNSEPHELLEFLRGKLPGPLVPQQIAAVASLPLLPNGKVDRAALPSLLGATQETPPEPLSREAESVAPIWKNLLHLDTEPHGDANFFRLGGNSLAAARLRTAIKHQLGMEVATGLIFEHPTLNAYAKAIIHNQAGNLAEVLEVDSSLANSLQFTPAAATAPTQLLVTGSTGFIGKFLVPELLSRGISVTALVRSANIPLPDGVRRVIGDIERPNFGLDPETYAALAGDIDSVVHAAAKVKFLEPYVTCRCANVLGTLEILKFCAAERPKTLTYFSTIAVFEALGASASEPILEGAALELSRGNAIGYTQSKWVAERLVQAAMHRGLSARIIRPGPTSGHSRTGQLNPDDFQGLFIAGCIAVGAYPDIESRMDFTPVDYVVSAAAELIFDPESLGRAYHLNTPHPLTIHEAFALLGIRKTDWATWWAAVQQHPDNPIANTLPVWEATIQSGFSPSDVIQIAKNFDTSNTRARVRSTCPKPDQKLITTLVSALIPKKLRRAGESTELPLHFTIVPFHPGKTMASDFDARDFASSPVEVQVSPKTLLANWESCGELANILALTNPANSLISPVANELVENVAKYSFDDTTASFKIWHTESGSYLQVTNSVALKDFFVLRNNVQQIADTPDLSELLITKMDQRDVNSGKSGIGLIMIASDFGVRLAVEIRGANAVTTVQIPLP